MNSKLSMGQFCGHRLHSRTVGGLVLTEYAYPPSHRISRHAHEAAYFSLVIAGGYAETFDNRHRECRTETVVFHPAGEMHAETMYEVETRTFNVEIPSVQLQDLREFGVMSDHAADYRGGVLSLLAARAYREFREGDDVSGLIIEGLTLEILGQARRLELSNEIQRTPKWLVKAKDLLQARFAERLSLDEIAREVGVHPVYLGQAFRKHFNSTIGEYVRTLRVQNAARTLVTSDVSLAVLALEMGFTDQSHFCKSFKRIMGFTPAHYRREFRVQS